MSSSQSPPVLADYIKRDLSTFEPALPKWKLAKSKLLYKVRLRLIEWYWKKKDPIYYLKCLCAAVVDLSENHMLLLRMEDVIWCPRTCAQMTTTIEVIVRDILSMSPGYLDRYIDRTNATHKSAAWAPDKDPTPQVKAHAIFFWSMATAVSENPRVTEGVVGENLRSISAGVPAWTTYMEYIAQTFVR